MFSSLLPKPKNSAAAPRVVLPSNERLVALTLQGVYALEQAKTASPHELAIQKVATQISGRKVQASYQDTVPLKQRYPNLKHHFPRYTLETCPDDSLKETVKETAAIVSQLIDKKNGVDPDADRKKTETTVVEYVTDETDRGRTLEIRNYQEDPMLPPKFKLRKNRHKEPSPPPPILKKSDETKLSEEDRAKWHIPAAISNWKNNQGFTLSLEKRMLAANGGSQVSNEINIEKRLDLAQALESADVEAREEIRVRNEILRERALREQQEKEARLKLLAEKKRLGASFDSNSKRRRHN